MDETTTRPDGPHLDARSLGDLSAAQWKSGIAAWLGWLFDGLDMHLYTLVAVPFVAELLRTPTNAASVGLTSSVIQAAFLVGWAFGGAFFGVIGDRIGRSRTLVLTILTYAAFTGLSAFATEWWHLLIFRFLAALGIGGEWAVGAALLSETWPRRWRPWLAAVLQSAVHVGIVVASIATFLLASQPPRMVFLVGILPAFITLWIRRAVPETEAWHAARAAGPAATPRIADLFRPPVLGTTLRALAVCGLSLTAHWAFTFWSVQHLRGLAELSGWSDADRSRLVSQGFTVLMLSSIAGNFLAAGLATVIGYRRTIAGMSLVYFLAMAITYAVPRGHRELIAAWSVLGACSGMFALYTMYLPPLFPTLLRTTGAGFCFNFGRLAAAAGTVFFGIFSVPGDLRPVLFAAGFVFLPATVAAFFLPELPATDAGTLSR
ncbi:MAG: MFS transporter [Planctomycetia bacterium]